MHKAHLIVGLILGLVFLGTGGYMFNHFPELYAGREEVRMMFRATHLYLLLAALINLMAANYLRCAPFGFGWSSKVKSVASTLILISPIALAVAFFYEPPAYRIERPITFWAIWALVIGVLLHSVAAFKWKSP